MFILISEILGAYVFQAEIGGISISKFHVILGSA
jgi:hypothetical protein